MEIQNSNINIRKNWPLPRLIEFAKVGEPSIGYISIPEMETAIPFSVKRSFWTYYTPESIIRGRHAHYITEQVLIAVAGKIVVTIENSKGEVQTFSLEKPQTGLYIPPNVWHTMMYSHNAVQLVFASTIYKADDYIRDYEIFRRIYE